jgi:hypothetical protein
MAGNQPDLLDNVLAFVESSTFYRGLTVTPDKNTYRLLICKKTICESLSDRGSSSSGHKRNRCITRWHDAVSIWSTYRNHVAVPCSTRFLHHKLCNSAHAQLWGRLYRVPARPTSETIASAKPGCGSDTAMDNGQWQRLIPRHDGLSQSPR